MGARGAGQGGTQIGLIIYNAEDTFMGTVAEEIQARAQGEADILYRASENSQITQNDQVEELLALGVDALIVNIVDRTSAVYIIRMAMAEDTPVIFINREPLYEDLALYERAYYLGNDPTESGHMSGDIAARYFVAHPQADKNGDGVIQYVLLRGQTGHQDTELRSVHSVRALEGMGLGAQCLAEDTAMWERALAQDKMASFLATYGDRIECVLSNNDDMALGAIEALKGAGYFTQGRFMPVVGVDATRYALEALAEGTLLGTVLNDAQMQGQAAFMLAGLLAAGQTVDDESFPYEVEPGGYVWMPSREFVSDKAMGE